MPDTTPALPARGPGDPDILTGQTRIGDDRRRVYTDYLTACTGLGLLDEDECNRRTGRALAAKTETQLAELVSDLPRGPEHPCGPELEQQVEHSGRRRNANGLRCAGYGGLILTGALAAVWIPEAVFTVHGWDRHPLMWLALIGSIAGGAVLAIGSAIAWCLWVWEG
jgi:hypothetical protein